MEDMKLRNYSKSKTENGGCLVLHTCVSVVDDRLNGLFRFEVDEGEVTQAVVCLDRAGDYVNRGLPFLSTECTCDVSPVGRGVCWRKDTS